MADPDLIQPFLPVGGAARVILTSNHQTVAELGAPVGVDVFTEAEGLVYLNQRTGLADPAGARELGSELGWLPLALAQAAAVITAQHLSFSAYLARMRRIPAADLLARVPGGQYPHGTAAAILLSLQTVTNGEDSAQAAACAAVMDLLAVLSPAGVPRELIRQAATAGLLGAAPLGAQAADVANASLGRLAGASLVNFSTDATTVGAPAGTASGPRPAHHCRTLAGSLPGCRRAAERPGRADGPHLA